MANNSRQFNKYKDPVLSFDRLLERAGIMPPGRYRGFDTIAASSSPVSGKIAIKLQHTQSGVQVITQSGTLSDLIGIAITPQGTIIHEEGEVDLPSLVVDFNQSNKARRDILVLEHTYQDNIPGENPPTYLIIKGTPADTPVEPALTNPDTQLILGYIEVPVNTTTVSGLYYHPALVPEFSKSGRIEALENVFDNAATLTKVGTHTVNAFEGITNIEAEGTGIYDHPTNQLKLHDDGNIFKLAADIPPDAIIKHIYPETGNWLRPNTIIFVVNNSTKDVRLVEGGNIKLLDDGTTDAPAGITLKGPHGAIALAYNLGAWVPAHSYIHRQLKYLREEVDRKAYKDHVYTRIEIDAAHLGMIAALKKWVTDNFEGKGVTPPPIPTDISINVDKTFIEIPADLATQDFQATVQGGTTNHWEIVSKTSWITLDNIVGQDLPSGSAVRVDVSVNDTGQDRNGTISIRSVEDTSKTVDIRVLQKSVELAVVPQYTTKILGRGGGSLNYVPVSVEGSAQGFTATTIYLESTWGTGWMTVTPGQHSSGARYITMDYFANPYPHSRTVLIKLASEEDPSVFAIITITQARS